MKGHTNIVKILIDANADVNRHDHPISTPIYVAVNGNYYAILKMLLSAGANPNHPEDLPSSGYASCLCRQYPSRTDRRILGLLLEYGAALKVYSWFNAHRDASDKRNWQYHERVKKAGGYDALVKTRRRVLSSFVDKCVEGKFGRPGLQAGGRGGSLRARGGIPCAAGRLLRPL